MESEQGTGFIDDDEAIRADAGSTSPIDDPPQAEAFEVAAPAVMAEPDPQGAPRFSAGPPDAAQILQDRPDVFRAFFEEYYGPHNDRNSSAWADRVGAATPEAYADYWYRTHGEMAGYGQEGASPIDVARILTDRPDVFRAFFTEYYGPNNDRHSNAWMDRVGGETVEDYAAYWYRTYGRSEGYTQAAAQAPTDESGAPPSAVEPQPAEVFEQGSDIAITTVGQSLTVPDVATA